MNRPDHRHGTTSGRPVVIRRTIVVHDQLKRGWIRATWHYIWHYRDPTLIHALAKLTCILFGLDVTAMGGEVASDITGIGLIDNLLLAPELAAWIPLFVSIIVCIWRARHKINDCRYEP